MRCGAALIDKTFVEDFLPSRLSAADIAHLKFSEGSEDRLKVAGGPPRFGREQILKQFIGLEHDFEGPLDGSDTDPSWIDPPPGVGTPDEKKLIKPGQLGITWYANLFRSLFLYFH
jgi:hypothetical protein